jgi:hypothetical protein
MIIKTEMVSSLPTSDDEDIETLYDEYVDEKGVESFYDSCGDGDCDGLLVRH